MAKVLTIVSTGAKTTATGVRGVKGAAESEYRDGYVNITPENIGFTIVEVESNTGTLSAEELKILKDNLHNYMGYSPDGEKRYIFKLTSVSSTNLQYSVVKEDLTGTMMISVDITTGDYLYSHEELSIDSQFLSNTERQDLIDEIMEVFA